MTWVSEKIERTALEDLHKVVPADLAASLGIQSCTIGSAFLSVAANLPASAIVINRTIGLGLSAPATQETARDIVETYRRAGIERYFVHIHPDARPDGIAGWFEDFGLEKARGWQKFSRGREAVPAARTDLSIRKIGQEHAKASAAILSDTFDLGDACRPWLERMVGHSRWHVFMSFDGDVPAGTGGLFIDGDIAWTDFGATSPEFRRRGSQSALLRHRIEYALDHGCRQIFTCTGEAVPGDPQHSYANILKAGFQKEYVRANYAPPK